MFATDTNITHFSVDIFDTLVFRLTKTPVDVFVGMEADPEVKRIIDNFTDYRVHGESLARRMAATDGREETSLDEIYECLSLLARCSEEDARVLKAKEIAAEKRAIKLSVFGREFLDHIKKTGARYVVTSDMYLPRDVIDDILENVGITGYEKLFLSSETQKSKHHGTAYDLVVDHFKVAPTEIMHIGDNWYPDVRMAELRGFRTHHLTPSNSLMHRVKRAKDNTFAYYGGHALSQAFIARFLEEECYKRATADVTELSEEKYFEAIGATILAPFVTAFSIWLAENASKHGVQKMAFLARDGQFMQKVFDLLHPEWETSYVAASRRLTTLPFTLLRPEVVKNFLHTTLENSETISEFFVKLRVAESIKAHMQSLGFDPDAKLDRRSRKKFLHGLSENSGPLLRAFGAEREAVVAYYEREFPEGQKSGLVDLGWRGSLQAAIEECLNGKRDIVGFYAGTSWDAIDILERRGFPHEAFTCMNGMGSYQAEMTGRYRDILEFFFSADHGSVYSVVKENDEYTWLKFDVSEAEHSAMQRARYIQNGAFKAIEDLTEKLSYDDIKVLTQGYDASDAWQFMQTPSRHDAHRFSSVRVFSGIGDEIGESLTMIGEKNSHQRNLKRSRWPEAYAATLGKLTRARVNYVRKKKKLSKV
ncbi:HAD family hydrolase [Ruegeria atlantica]|uniref:HAD family hydrolase n=1 Tax=Ruegeria atlantica TaxID=81569 RepID=UPI0014808FFA|nr:HAD family hydrolase [Ruegeria atlantica]